MTHPDLAEYLQARILSDLPVVRVALRAEVALVPEAPVASAEAEEPRQEELRQEELRQEELRQEEPRQEEPRQVEALEARIAALEEAVARAEAMAEQRREEAEAATYRADQLVADLIEITGELLEAQKSDQAAA